MILAERYGDSPYLAMLRGEEPEGYRLLEDSLLAFAAAQPVSVQRAPGVRAVPGEPAGARRRAPGADRPDDPGASRRDVR